MQSSILLDLAAEMLSANPRFPPAYIGVEALTGILFLITWLVFGPNNPLVAVASASSSPGSSPPRSLTLST